MRMPLKWGDRKLKILQQQQLRWKNLDVKMGKSNVVHPSTITYYFGKDIIFTIRMIQLKFNLLRYIANGNENLSKLKIIIFFIN